MAKKQITKEQIVQAATALVAERGMEFFNARNVAERCGCSTQPIYLCFDNMRQLEERVAEQMQACYDKYIAEEIASGKYPEYKASGMGYIRFAKEQPNFFKYLFMRDRSEETDDAQAYQFKREAKRVQNYGFDENAALRMHTHMWVYVHGIAAMYATGYLNWAWNDVSELLTEEFFALKDKLFGGNDDSGNKSKQ